MEGVRVSHQGVRAHSAEGTAGMFLLLITINSHEILIVLQYLTTYLV